MGRKKKKVKVLQEKIRIRLDYKTIITLRDLDALDAWLQKYPQAKVI